MHACMHAWTTVICIAARISEFRHIEVTQIISKNSSRACAHMLRKILILMVKTCLWAENAVCLSVCPSVCLHFAQKLLDRFGQNLRGLFGNSRLSVYL